MHHIHYVRPTCVAGLAYTVRGSNGKLVLHGCHGNHCRHRLDPLHGRTGESECSNFSFLDEIGGNTSHLIVGSARIGAVLEQKVDTIAAQSFE